jgi:hypothetical protein
MMDAQRQRDLWAIAVENYQAARFTAQQGWHNVSVGRSYYAVYTAMWMAVDEPPSGQWCHPGILQHFSQGGGANRQRRLIGREQAPFGDSTTLG